MPIKNITGKKFGMLTLTKYLGKPKSDHKFQCTCDCGKIFSINWSSIRSGAVTSCGCDKYTDLSGQKIGKVAVLKRFGKFNYSSTRYICVCDCGTEFLRTHSSLSRGGNQSCQNCRYSWLKNNKDSKR